VGVVPGRAAGSVRRVVDVHGERDRALARGTSPGGPRANACDRAARVARLLQRPGRLPRLRGFTLRHLDRHVRHQSHGPPMAQGDGRDRVLQHREVPRLRDRSYGVPRRRARHALGRVLQRAGRTVPARPVRLPDRLREPVAGKHHGHDDRSCRTVVGSHKPCRGAAPRSSRRRATRGRAVDDG
jgi:hypothetical protein